MKKIAALNSLVSLALLLSVVPALIVALSSLPASAQTSTPLIRPHGLAYDASGNYYIADTDQNVIRKVSTTGIITTVAGTGEQGYAGDGGLATAAMLDSPAGVAVDSSGNIYIADTHNNVIREVLASNGNIATIAGTGVAGYSGDSSTAIAAMLSSPTAVAVDSNGNVYVADTNNHCIRKVIGTNIFTVAGNGEQSYSGDGGPATAAGLDSPNGVAVDSSFNIYIGDTHNQRVRMVTFATGHISTIAGSGVNGYNGEGTATAIDLSRPRGVAVDPSGNVYVADSDNNLIRSISGGNVNTIAGTSLEGFSGDGGAATSASLDTPDAVAIAGASILFSDTENNLVREVSGGIINPPAVLPSLTSPAPGSTLSGSGITFSWDPGSATAFRFLLGTAPGWNNYYGSGQTTRTSETVTVPTGGVTLYARLYYLMNGTWSSIDYTYTESGSPAPPSMTSPTPGSTLSGLSQMFAWDPGAGATLFELQVGALFPGSTDVYKSGSISTTTANVPNIPGKSVNLYVTLWYRMNGTWRSIGYVYKESGSTQLPFMTSPSPGSTLGTSPAQMFTWDPGAGATLFQLQVGTLGKGSTDVYKSGWISTTSANVPNIPTNGSPLYVRLGYRIDGVWHSIDYVYTEPGP
jgi:sugar lactone lactonase YvrE